MLEYVYGTKKRIFVNNVIGCCASCKYCYLTSIRKNQKKCRISSDEVIKKVNEMEEFIPGKQNTIVSLGCYSECLASENVNDTVNIICHFCEQKNYIQLATKQKIPESVCEILAKNRKFSNQINIYVSMPTYSKIELMEPGTVCVEERINNIRLCKKYGLNVILYIKPFLEEITFRDIEFYIDIVKKYNIPVVVGNYLTVHVADCLAEVGEDLLYENIESEEMKLFMNTLSKYTDVYLHSTDFIEEIRIKEKNYGTTNS